MSRGTELAAGHPRVPCFYVTVGESWKEAMSVRRDLGGGLVLRRARPEDSEALAAFNGYVHRSREDGEADESLSIYTRDLMAGALPTVGPSDFTVVEDTSDPKSAAPIVSSLGLISQTWAYTDAGESVCFGLGRIELVGTDPAYRAHGLVRAQIDEVHRWSAERGELVQCMGGIPYFYRQFGYELALGSPGGRSCHPSRIPRLAPGQTEAYRVRPAVGADLPLFSALVERGDRRYLVSCRRDAELWRYELSGRSRDSFAGSALSVVELGTGETVGCLVHDRWLKPNWSSSIGASTFELVAGASWPEATPCVLRYLLAIGERSAREGTSLHFNRLALGLGLDHPACRVAATVLNEVNQPGVWYVRVADVPAFLRQTGPVLEARLQASPLAGYTGEFKLSFYRAGTRLAFERGRLTAAEPWRPSPSARGCLPDAHGHASFPDFSFLKLLFGYRDLDELHQAFPDCLVHGDDSRMLLEILFPKRPSHLWPLS